MHSILLKTRIHRGNRDRKFDVSMKGCLGSEKICKLLISKRNERCQVLDPMKFDEIKLKVGVV